VSPVFPVPERTRRNLDTVRPHSPRGSLLSPCGSMVLLLRPTGPLRRRKLSLSVRTVRSALCHSPSVHRSVCRSFPPSPTCQDGCQTQSRASTLAEVLRPGQVMCATVGAARRSAAGLHLGVFLEQAVLDAPAQFEFFHGAVEHGHDEHRHDLDHHAAEAWDGHRDHDVRASAGGGEHG